MICFRFEQTELSQRCSTYDFHSEWISIWHWTKKNEMSEWRMVGCSRTKSDLLKMHLLPLFLYLNVAASFWRASVSTCHDGTRVVSWQELLAPWVRKQMLQCFIAVLQQLCFSGASRQSIVPFSDRLVRTCTVFILGLLYFLLRLTNLNVPFDKFCF